MHGAMKDCGDWATKSGTLLPETVELNSIFRHPQNFPDTVVKVFFNRGIKGKLGVQMGVRNQFSKLKT